MFLKGNKLQQKYSDDLINSAIEYYLNHKESIKDVSNKFNLKFSLQKNDVDAVKAFKNAIEFAGAIIVNRNNIGVSIGSKSIYNDLNRYGVIERKSGKEIIPFGLIPDDLIRHFIRGYFDGDGCISADGTIQICCGKSFAEFFY